MTNVRKSNSIQTLHRKILCAESLGEKMFKSPSHAMYPDGFLSSTVNPLCRQKPVFFYYSVHVGQVVLRCKRNTHRGVTPHLTLWRWWQDFLQLSVSEALHCIWCCTALVRSDSQALLSFAMFSLVTAVINYPGGKGCRINAKHYKPGSLCGSSILLPPTGLEFLSCRSFKCWKGREKLPLLLHMSVR